MITSIVRRLFVECGVYIMFVCVLDDGDALGVVLMVGFVRWYLFIFFIKCQSRKNQRERI